MAVGKGMLVSKKNEKENRFNTIERRFNTIECSN